ncbi:WXG100 family type VII secretion target [Nocardioides sediminis]|uniref:WXG100 family type VII secretion target n=1 Tax=Nocardioides sediminis TaxID=433648 RepID=UPI000D319FD5|nr:WXG100 family type VII secretion target [Nocardioides sediminis]
MTAYDVDVDELVAVIAAMEACGQGLADLATEVESAHRVLHDGWTGLASDAHTTSHSSWRSSFAEMTAALEGLRTVGDTSRSNYTLAVEANVAMWEQVR